jgi:predicted DNA-binding protein YlxM (UPF0122 family)
MVEANERKTKMIEMMNNGCSYSEIGKAFNLSRQRVFQILNPRDEVERLLASAKAETARKIFADIHTEIQEALESNYKARKERSENRHWGRINDDFINRVNGKIESLRGIDDFVSKLEDKYIKDIKGGAE